DHDGSHIKGLLINLLHSCWPSLLKHPSFLREFITPIVKATGPRGRTLAFYTIPEYEAWKRTLGSDARQWKVKYYKGLGTSTPKEAKEYFAQLDRHRKDFEWGGEGDGERIEMAFSKKAVDARKQWLRSYEPGTYLDQTAQRISYSDFVDKELILYSLADNMRSIPSVVDGLKPGQRKILFSCFKRKLHSDIKVAQLAGYVSEHAAYHHGEQSLMSTIVNLAQDFVGSNNVHLLVPSGQFGTRLQGGKDAASPRYIYTRLHRLTRVIFPVADDALLDYLDDDGQRIEPKWYVPILPLVLINGSEGIGTGWSSYVPTFNPRDVVANLKRRMRGEPMLPMHPWFRGFKGSIQLTSARQGGGNSYTVTGVATRLTGGGGGGRKGEKQPQQGVTGVTITELPIRTWTQTYKEFLEGMMGGAGGHGGGEGGGKVALVKDMREYHTDTSRAEGQEEEEGEEARREREERRARAQWAVMEKRLKLTTTMNTGNMHLFDAAGRMKKYDSPEEIIEDFYGIRLGYYEQRKEHQVAQLRHELLRLDNRARFVRAVIQGDVVITNRKQADIVAQLKATPLSHPPFHHHLPPFAPLVSPPLPLDLPQARGFTPLPKGHAAAPVVVADVDPGSTDVSADGEDVHADVEMDDVEAPAGQKTGKGKNTARAAGKAAAAGTAPAAAAPPAAAAYEYLLGMALWSLTWERVEQLERERRGKEEEVVVLQATSPLQLWERDLDLFLETLEEEVVVLQANSPLQLWERDLDQFLETLEEEVVLLQATSPLQLWERDLDQFLETLKATSPLQLWERDLDLFLETLEATSPLQLWERDLDLFLETLEEVEAEAAEDERERERAANQHKARGRNAAGRKGGKQQAGGPSRGKKAGVTGGGGTGGGGGGGGRGKAKGAVGETGIGDGGRRGGDRAQGGIGAAVPVDTPTPRQSTPRHSSRLTRTQAASAAAVPPTAAAAAPPDAASPQQSNEQAGTQAQGNTYAQGENDAEGSGGQGGEQEQEDVDPSPPFPPPSPAAAGGMRESPPVIEMTSSEEGGAFGLQVGGLRLGDSVSDAGDTSNTSSGNAHNGDTSNGFNSPSAASDPYSLHASPSASPPLSTPLHTSSTPNPPASTATPPAAHVAVA
ncbi:unnamed protein product, partial [Closterium sp. Naga37s-1]